MNSLSRKRSLKWDTSSSSSSSSSPWSSPAAKRRKKTTAIASNDNSNSNSKSKSKSKRESKLPSKLKWKKEKNGNNEMVEGCETRDCVRQTIKAKTNELNDLWNELKHITKHSNNNNNNDNNGSNNGSNNGNNNDNNDWNEKSKTFMLKAEKCINDSNGILNNCVNKIENEILKPLNNEKENLKYLTKTFKNEMNDIKTNNNEKINKITNEVLMLETKIKKYQTKILDLSKEKKKLQRELTFQSKNIESQLKKTSNQLNKLKKEEILWNDEKNKCFPWISTPNNNDNDNDNSNNSNNDELSNTTLIKQFKNELDSLKKKLIENSNNIDALCIACYDAKPCVKYCGCNHESLCYPCYSKWNIDNNTCPLCRKQKFRVTIKFS